MIWVLPPGPANVSGVSGLTTKTETKNLFFVTSVPPVVSQRFIEGKVPLGPRGIFIPALPPCVFLDTTEAAPITIKKIFIFVIFLEFIEMIKKWKREMHPMKTKRINIMGYVRSRWRDDDNCSEKRLVVQIRRGHDINEKRRHVITLFCYQYVLFIYQPVWAQINRWEITCYCEHIVLHFLFWVLWPVQDSVQPCRPSSSTCLQERCVLSSTLIACTIVVCCLLFYDFIQRGSSSAQI